MPIRQKQYKHLYFVVWNELETYQHFFLIFSSWYRKKVKSYGPLSIYPTRIHFLACITYTIYSHSNKKSLFSAFFGLFSFCIINIIVPLACSAPSLDIIRLLISRTQLKCHLLSNTERGVWNNGIRCNLCLPCNVMKY